MGPLPPGNAMPAAPTHDEKLFAGLAYLSYLAGLWFIGPLAIYGFKGRQSDYVRFHAGQAFMATLGVVLGLVVGGTIYVIGLVAVVIIAGTTDNPVAIIIVEVVRTVALLAFSGLPTAALLLCSIPAFRGTRRQVPLIGKYAPRVQEPLFRMVDGMAGGTST